MALKIPEGATAVRAESATAQGYVLIFTTPYGEVTVGCGPDMIRAIKLVSRISRILKTQKAVKPC